MASQEVERVNKHYGRIEEKISKMIKQTKSAPPAPLTLCHSSVSSCPRCYAELRHELMDMQHSVQSQDVRREFLALAERVNDDTTELRKCAVACHSTSSPCQPHCIAVSCVQVFTTQLPGVFQGGFHLRRAVVTAAVAQAAAHQPTVPVRRS